jgi:hypothetical protein
VFVANVLHDFKAQQSSLTPRTTVYLNVPHSEGRHYKRVVRVRRGKGVTGLPCQAALPPP